MGLLEIRQNVPCTGRCSLLIYPKSLVVWEYKSLALTKFFKEHATLNKHPKASRGLEKELIRLGKQPQI